MNLWIKMSAVLTGTALLCSLEAVPVYSASVLQIGSSSGSSGYLYGSEVVAILNTSLQIHENGTGLSALENPLLLILGVANDEGSFVAPAITLSRGSGSIGGTSNFGGIWNTTTGYVPDFDSSTSGSVYDFIGLSPKGNESNSFKNWYDAEKAVNGISATSFGIYVYQLYGTGITGGSTVDVTFASPLGKGAFAVAYGQALSMKEKVDAFSTPLTESGLTRSQVPVPGIAVLLSSGLLGLLSYGKRRNNAKTV